MTFSNLAPLFTDIKLMNGIIDILMSEASLAAAIFDSNSKLLVSTASWQNEYSESSVKNLVDEALLLFGNSGEDFSSAKSYVNDNKTLVCFPVLTSAQDIAAVFLLKETSGNKSRNILNVYHDIFENFEEGYFELDIKGNLTYCNERIAEITGISRNELYGLNFRTYTTQSTADQLFAVYSEIFRTGKPSKISNFEVIKRDGSTAVFEVSSGLLKDDIGLPLGFRGICRDASERIMAENEKRLLSEQLQQAQRFEAVATMAGGIAHDFNNLLMSIQGYLSLLQLDTDSESKNHDYLKRIEEQVERGASLTKQMLGFSFSDAGFSCLAKVDINSLVSKTAINFIGAKPEIQLILSLSPTECFANCDASQIGNVLLNLMANACQSMPAGGRLTITTGKTVCGEEQAGVFRARPGEYIKIGVADTGLGMDEITKRRIFNPFFTTSDNGQSNGLGLTTAFGIIKNHGGFITISSELGAGTSISVYLPSTIYGLL